MTLSFADVIAAQAADCLGHLSVALPGVDSAQRDRRLPSLLQARLLAADRQFQRTWGPQCAALLPDEQRDVAGVISASAGNHALGLAYHGKSAGHPCHGRDAQVRSADQAARLAASSVRRSILHGESFHEAFDHARATGSRVAAHLHPRLR